MSVSLFSLLRSLFLPIYLASFVSLLQQQMKPLSLLVVLSFSPRMAEFPAFTSSGIPPSLSSSTLGSLHQAIAALQPATKTRVKPTLAIPACAALT
eukprot:2644602-Rhodomonas_salina.1